MNRRQVLQRGAASILITGATACQSEPPGASAWSLDPKRFEDIRLQFLSDAILAPSPHNRQPWLIELDKDNPNRLTVWPDLTRLLPQTDPFHRQITIGLGAFIEAFCLSAAEATRSCDISLYPEGTDPIDIDTRPVATITLDAPNSARPDPLFALLKTRRTNRTQFEDRPVAKADLLGLGTALNQQQTYWGATSDNETCDVLRGFCRGGWEIESSTPRTHLESVSLTRIGRREIEASPDGISLSGPAISTYKALGILSREKMKDPNSRASAEGLRFYNGLIESARSFAWLVTDDNSRTSQISAGRDWLRVHLAATRAGLAFQPLSQVLQEFPEMSNLYNAVHAQLSIETPSRIQGLFRLGYAKAPMQSPRWPLETRLIDMPPSEG